MAGLAGMETLLAEGKALAIGISNHMVRYLEELLSVANVIPAVNRQRIFQNGDVFDFSISDVDMAYLETFNHNLVTGWDPTHMP